MTPVSYKILADAVEFYGQLGYKYVEVPWAVPWRAVEITTPPDAPSFRLGDDFLVASGEQGFLHMLQYNLLPKDGKYLCVTPCFRGEKEYNEYSLPYFIKAELIITGSEKEIDFSKVLVDARKFFQRYLPRPLEIVPTTEGKDIFYEGVELGSYGIRKHPSIGPWIYGTGVAEPRFSRVLDKIPKGYSEAAIPRGVFGELSKIREEYEEIRDAMAQSAKIMALVELSDMYGAMEGFLARNFPGMTMEDVVRMSAITHRAFENGYRA